MLYFPIRGFKSLKVIVFFILILIMSTLNALCDDSLFIDGNGNVGIGESDPYAQLVVREDFAGSQFITDFVGASSDGAYIGITESGSKRWVIGLDDGSNFLRIREDSNTGSVAITIDDSGNVCLGYVNVNPSYKLNVNGTTRSYGFFDASDKRWKEDIETIDDSLTKISKLRGVTYKWKDKEKGKKLKVGLIAQEVEEVYPEVVSTDSDGYKSIEYSKLIAPLIEAVKELKAKNDNLRDQNDSMKEALAKLEKRISALESSK